MMKRAAPSIRNIARFLDTTLRVKKIPDASANGLQSRPRKAGEIAKVGFAVDACLTTFEKAKKLGVELLIVHHGIKWRPQKDRALTEKRAAFLKKNDMALYAVHSPLDLHEEYGNNVQLARLLKLGRLRKFGTYHGIKIGYSGTFGKATTLPALAATLRRRLPTEGRIFPFGKKNIRSIGIVSGGGGSLLKEAVDARLDCFLVGELDLAAYNAAKDQGMNLIVAGHYATETVGVKALMPLVRKSFGVETFFIEDEKTI